MRIQIAENIKKYRMASGYTQSDIAILLSVSPQAVSRWETGRGYPDTALLLKLAEILGITVDELLKGELSSTAPNRKSFNYNINYKAERALFARFSLTLIPLFAFFVWIILIGIIPNTGNPIFSSTSSLVLIVVSK